MHSYTQAEQTKQAWADRQRPLWQMERTELNLCSCSYRQQLRQKGNQRINNSQCRTVQTVFLKWLIVSLMVQQLFMVITLDFQETMHDVVFFLLLLVCFFSSHKNWNNSVFAFVVWKIYLMACPLSLCSCDLVCWELFSLLRVSVWKPPQETLERGFY